MKDLTSKIENLSSGEEEIEFYNILFLYNDTMSIWNALRSKFHLYMLDKITNTS